MASKRNSTGEPDYVLIMIVATLVALGLLMVYSASYAWGLEEVGDPDYFFWRQLVLAAIGIGGAVVMYRIDYRTWRRWAIPIMAVALLSLLAVLIFGEERFHARRAFRNGSIQPSEGAKLALVIYAATWLASKGQKLRQINYGLIPYACLLGMVCGLVALEPDLSTTFLLAVIGLGMFFIAGADLKQMAIGLAGGGITLGLLVLSSPHGRSRIHSFLNALRHPSLVGNPSLTRGEYQTEQALRALTRGGWWGVGFGNGQGKLPGRVILPYTDGIFAILGEEAGLIGGLLVISLFAALAYRGFRIAAQAPDQYGMLLATGITIWLVSQALIHIAVIVKLFPVTGMTLPFISQGGSSLVSCLAAVGLLLNISRGGSGGGKKETIREPFDLRRRNRGTRLPASRRRGSAAQRDNKKSRSSRSITTRKRASSRSATRRGHQGTARSVRRRSR